MVSVNKKFVNAVKQLLNVLRSKKSWYYRFKKNYKNSSMNAEFLDLVKAYFYGFHYQNYKLFKINKENRKNYVSDLKYENAHPINRSCSSIIDNKLYLPFFLKDYKELVPKYFYYIDNGCLVNLQCGKNLNNNPENILNDLSKEKKLVLKHCSRSKGEGFYLLESQNDQIFLNKNAINKKNFFNFIKSLNRYIITEFIYQHDYASEISPNSTNTIRILCAYDYEIGEFFIASAFHRFGFENKLVDNISSGNGMLFYIDLKNGCIKKNGLLKRLNFPFEHINDIYHPTTNKKICDIKIPYWENIKSTTLDIVKNISFIKYIGFDIVVTNENFKILETNSLHSLLTLHGDDEFQNNIKLKNFFKYHKIME